MPCCRAPQVFVRCGLLRQLQTVLARCLGPQMHQFSVAVRKMLEITLKLPFTTDDIWHTRTAQGSFAAALAQLARLRVAHGRVAVRFCAHCTEWECLATVTAGWQQVSSVGDVGLGT